MSDTERVAEPYIGEVMLQCHAQMFDFRHTNAIVVSGASLNPCGHMLLSTGGGWYFHVAVRKGPPRYMREPGYARYLKDHGKRQLRRTPVRVPEPEAAHRKLEELLGKPWSWWVLPNNCASFVEDVVRAGGSKAGLYFNCPVAERFR